MSESRFIPDDKLPRYTRDKLQTVRKRELGHTQEKLAELVGCDTKTVQRYESGESPIPLEFIRTVEKLRVQERERRARESGADEIDFSTLLLPGLELIELIPNVHVRELMGKLARMFVAVPKEWLDPSAEGGQRPPSPTPDSGPIPSGRRTRSAALVTRTEFRMGLACMGVAIFGAVVMLRSEIRSTLSSPRSLRVARDAKVERPTVPPAAVREQPAPDAVDEQPEDAQAEKELLQVPGQIYTDKAKVTKEEMGTEAKTRHSIKMPNKPYSWQQGAPCATERKELEMVGGCWIREEGPPPCSDMAVESEGRCFVPVTAKPVKPNTVEPKK